MTGDKTIMISAALCFLLGSCTLNEENVNCYEANLFASINLLTTTKIDSTKLSCNNKDFRFFNESFICMDTTISTHFITDTISQLGKYTCSRDYPLWYAYHFFSTPFNKIELESTKLNLIIYGSEIEQKIDISEFISGGQITNIITEKDTVSWFSQDENFVVPYFSDYKSPLLSIRLGCRDGYCFAALPITESEFCYDHSL